MFRVAFIFLCALSLFGLANQLSNNLSVQAIDLNAITAIADVPITIKTHVTAKAGLDTRDSSNWPKFALYINNGTNFDGPYDYGSCASAGTGCGTPNLYNDKIQPGDCGNYFCPTATTQVLETQVSVGKLLMQPDQNTSDRFITKLSYVFFNDYWNPNTTPVTDRDFGISKIEFYAPNGTLLSSLTPASPTYGVEAADAPDLIGVYFDYGLVNAEGIANNEQNGMVAAFDAVDRETIVQNKSREQGKWELTKEGSINFISDNLATKILANIFPEETTPPEPTPPSTTVKFVAASDGTLPWTKNAEQNRLGPTTAWTDPTSHIATICNGAWCWRSNFATGLIENSGNPIDLRAAFGSNVQTTESQSLWKNGGPKAGWEDYKNNLVSLTNDKFMWLWGTGGWANNGQGIDLSTQQYWKDTVAASDGTTLFSGAGISAAWTDKVNSREYFCNTKWCWVFNYNEMRWHNQDDVGKGRPFDITDLFKIAPAGTGINITANNGPTVGWTNDVNNTSTICNEGFCWSYVQQAGSRPDLLDVTWQQANNQGLGQPLAACTAVGESSDVCSGVVVDPEPITGDFDQNDQVDIFDYNLLFSKFGTEFCMYNLAGSCSIDTQDIEAFVTLFGTQR